MDALNTLTQLRHLAAKNAPLAEAIDQAGVILSDPVVSDYVVAHWGEMPKCLIDLSSLPEGVEDDSSQSRYWLEVGPGPVPRVSVRCRGAWSEGLIGVPANVVHEDLADWINDHIGVLVASTDGTDGRYPLEWELEGLRQKVCLGRWFEQSYSEEIATELLTYDDPEEAAAYLDGEDCGDNWVLVCDEDDVRSLAASIIDPLVEAAADADYEDDRVERLMEIVQALRDWTGEDNG